MQKNFARKTFNRWIKKNRYRFKFPPYISKSRKDYFVLQNYLIKIQSSLRKIMEDFSMLLLNN